MQIATFQGIRGGVGTTSVVAMLADALHRQGEHVLVVDTNPSDVLRLFFNVAQADGNGWAGALSQGQPWHESAFRVDQRLDLIPFGRNSLQNGPHAAAELTLSETFWLEALEHLKGNCSWLLFDLPSVTSHYTRIQAKAHLDIRVASTDAGCHVSLAQTHLPKTCKLLASLYDPTRTLSGDILLDWRYRYHDQIIPFPMHRDEAVHEALAQKTTVQLLYPDAVGAQDAHSLATWCRTHKGSESCIG